MSHVTICRSPTFLPVVSNFAVAVFDHLRVGDTGISNIVGRVKIRATLVGGDLGEGGTPRSWSVEHEDHLTRSQDAGVPEKKIRRNKR